MISAQQRDDANISCKQNKVVLLLPRVVCEGTQSYCEGTQSFCEGTQSFCEGTQTLRSLANEKNNFSCHVSTTVELTLLVPIFDDVFFIGIILYFNYI